MPWLRLVAPPAPSRAELAFRLALICTLVTWVTGYYGIPEPALVAYLAFFINRPERTTSAILCVAFLVLATLLIGLVFGLAHLVLEHPLWRVGAMVLISLSLLFLTSASKLKAVGGIITLVLAFALDLMSAAPMAELLTRGLLYGWLFVAIPAGISLAVNLTLAPSPRRQVECALAQRLQEAAEVLRGHRDAGRLSRALQDDAELQTALGRIALERSAPAADLDALRRAVDSSVVLLSAIVAGESAPGPASQPAQMFALADTLCEMAEVFRGGGYPVDIHLALEAPYPHDPHRQAAWQTMVDAVRGFAEGDPRPQPSAAPKEGFWAADAWTSPVHRRYALKTTLAAMLCYLLYTVLHWPGIHTCMITCYIVSLDTVAESVEKLTLRLLGCLAGAALGLATTVFVLPEVSTAETYLTLVFAGTLASAWFAAGSPRISYFGFQMAFAFFLCVIQGSGPAFDMVAARDRVIGIVLGNVVAYLIATRLWPIRLSGRIGIELDRLAATLLSLNPGSGAVPSPRAVATLHADLGRLRADVWRLRYERWLPGAQRQAARACKRLLDDAERAACLPALAIGGRLSPSTVTAIACELSAIGRRCREYAERESES